MRAQVIARLIARNQILSRRFWSPDGLRLIGAPQHFGVSNEKRTRSFACRPAVGSTALLAQQGGNQGGGGGAGGSGPAAGSSGGGSSLDAPSARDQAPGQMKEPGSSARDVAPGQTKEPGTSARDQAPGQNRDASDRQPDRDQRSDTDDRDMKDRKDGQKADRTDGKESQKGGKVSSEQKAKVKDVFKSHRVEPAKNVNFSLSVGTRVPRDIRFYAIPRDIVVIVPQYESYRYFLVGDSVVIVDPGTYEIVDVIVIA